MTGIDMVSTTGGPRLRFSSRLAAAGAVAVSAALAGLHPKVARHGDQVFVQASAAAGSFAVVLALFLVTVVGLGRIPHEGERSLVVLAMAGAAAGALVFAPVREHLARRVRRMITSSVRDTIEELRSLAHGIYPPCCATGASSPPCGRRRAGAHWM